MKETMRNSRNAKRLLRECLESRSMLAGDLVPLVTFGPLEFNSFGSTGYNSAATLGDFNDDGVTDIVFGTAHIRRLLTEDQSSVGVAIGDGKGGFEVLTEQQLHDDVFSLVIEDMNGDGHDDVVAGGIFRLTLLLSKVDEQGNWIGLDKPRYLGGASERIVVEDFNGDGFKDIATAAVDHPFGLFWEDFPDPVFADRDVKTVTVYSNDGDGEFSIAARLNGMQYLHADDYDSDGDVDLLTRWVPDNYRSEAEDHQAVIDGLPRQRVGASFHVLENASSEEIAFSAGDQFGWEEFKNLQPAPAEYDINNDGYPDQLASSKGYDWGNYYSPTQTTVAFGTPSGEFEAPLRIAGLFYGSNTWEFGWGQTLRSAPAPAVFDIDSNGLNDLVAFGGNVVIRQGLLEGYAFEAHNYPSSSNALHRSRFVDVNSDGRLDMVSGLLIQESKPDGSFGESYEVGQEELQSILNTDRGIQVQRGFSPVAIDVNGDGKPESLPRRFDDFELVLVKDTNDDSHLDLVLHRDVGGERFRYVQLGDGSGTFTEPELDIQPIVTTALTRGGISVMVREDSAILDYWESPIVATFQIPVPNETLDNSLVGSPHHEATKADVDGDGDRDIIVAHGSGVAVILAVGEGDFDEDGELTMDDFAILMNNYGRTDALPSDGDTDSDGDIDFADFLNFSRTYIATPLPD